MKKVEMDLDKFQDEIGGISKYQVLIILMVCWTSFSTSLISQASNFLNAVPEYRCFISFIDSDSNQCNLTEHEILNLTIPVEAPGKYSSCDLLVYNTTSCGSSCEAVSCIEAQFDDATQGECSDGYVYDYTIYGETTTTEFDIVCDRRYLDTVGQTLFFAGFFVGSLIIGPVCDWFGRIRAVAIMTLGFFGVTVGCTFSPSYEVFMITRLLSGCFGMASYIAVFTYVTEIANTKRRTEAAMWTNLSSAFSHTVFPGIAYFSKNWRLLQFIISLTPIPFFLMYYFLPETPRWLLANGKHEKAKITVGRYARSKRKILSDDTWNLIVKTENEKLSNAKLLTTAQKIHVWDLFRRPLMRILCFNVMFSWFTVSMVFYGLALNGGNLAGDPYVNNTLNAVVEIFAYFCIYFSYLFGRRSVLITSFVFAGLFCLTSMLFDLYSYDDKNLLTASTVFAITGKFFASLAFAVIYSVTSEIFPTTARATGVSLGSMAARVGGMLSPLILQQQETIPWLTQTIFGVLSIIAGLLCLLYPETASTEFISTMNEAESYYEDNMKLAKLIKIKSASKSHEVIYKRNKQTKL